MVASRFYIAMVVVRFPLKVQKYLYLRNWYTAIEGESSGNSPEMVTGSNPVYKYFKLGLHVPRLARMICNQSGWVRFPSAPLCGCDEIGST